MVGGLLAHPVPEIDNLEACVNRSRFNRSARGLSSLAVKVVAHVDERDRREVGKRGQLCRQGRPRFRVQGRRERDEDGSPGRAQQICDLPRLEHWVDRQRRAGGFASPDCKVGFRKIGQDERSGTIGRNAERSEKVRRARHVGDEFAVAPDMRFVEVVGRRQERQRFRVGSAFRAGDERRIGALRKVPLDQRNRFNRGDVG